VTEELSRQALYELVWATPVRTLAQRFNISDVGLRKACQRSHIPLPPAGYWAKVAAGKKVMQPALPARPSGMRDTVTPGAGRYGSYFYRQLSDAELLGPLPARPTFTPDLDAVRAACLKQVDKVTVPRDLAHPHHAIAKLLAIDEQRRIAQLGRGYVSSWDAPRFTSPFEQRRLRVLGALMMAVGRAGASIRLTGKNARSIYVTVHDTSFWLRLDDEAGISKEASEYEPPETVTGSALFLAISSGHGSAPSIRWGDDKTGKLETKLHEAVAEIFVHAEANYRSMCEHQHEWRIERRADRLNEIHLARLKAEQAERDRIERLKQERIARLLGEAEALQKAETIRAYVASARDRASAHASEEVVTWAQWALDVASSIDPVESGAFLIDFTRDS
jgi:hypothetical protein